MTGNEAMLRNLSDINLLVFDLDGTILPATRPAYEAINKCHNPGTAVIGDTVHDVRAIIRDIPIWGEDILHRYEEKYWPAQRKHLAEYPPLLTADMIIDNMNWEHPVVTYTQLN